MPYTYNAQDVFDFANANGFQYRQKGNEITFKLCPYCNGGNTPDKETFSINRDTGAYKCLRNSCSRQGHFVQLARDFGYKLDMGEQKVYRSLPQTKPEDRVIRDTAISYLESRGISKEICRKYFITAQSNKPDVIVFPFYDENNVLQLVKYRNSKKLSKSAKTSDPQVFAESIFPKTFDDVAQESYIEQTEAFSSMFQNKSKYTAMMAALADMLYREFNNYPNP